MYRAPQKKLSVQLLLTTVRGQENLFTCWFESFILILSNYVDDNYNPQIVLCFIVVQYSNTVFIINFYYSLWIGIEQNIYNYIIFFLTKKIRTHYCISIRCKQQSSMVQYFEVFQSVINCILSNRQIPILVSQLNELATFSDCGNPVFIYSIYATLL